MRHPTRYPLFSTALLSLVLCASTRAQDKCITPVVQTLNQARSSLTPESAAHLTPQRLEVEPHEIDGELLVNLRKASILEAKARAKSGTAETPIRGMSSPTSVRYIVDAEGKLYWIEIEGRPQASDQLYAGKEGSPRGLIPVMETGRLHYEAATKQWKLDVDWSSGLKPEEVEHALAEVEKRAQEGPDGKPAKDRAAPAEKERDAAAKKLARKRAREERLARGNLRETVLSCAEVMEGQLAGKGGLSSRIGLDLLSSGIVGGVKQASGSADYLGLHADTDEKRARARHDRQVMVADTIGNIASSVVMTGVDQGMANSVAGNVQQFMIRAGARYGVGVQGQRIISGQIIDDQHTADSGTSKSTAAELTKFNNGWFAFRMSSDPFISKFISADLPGYAFNACKSGSLLRVILSPGVIRIVERTATTTLYFGLRSHFTGN